MDKNAQLLAAWRTVSAAMAIFLAKQTPAGDEYARRLSLALDGLMQDDIAKARKWINLAKS